MTKKEYISPSIKVVPIMRRPQLLAGSLPGVTTTGLDNEPPVILDPSNPKSILDSW